MAYKSHDDDKVKLVQIKIYHFHIYFPNYVIFTQSVNKVIPNIIYSSKARKKRKEWYH